MSKNNDLQRIDSVSGLGSILRDYRKEQNLTLEKVSDISNLSMRFLSELERGKETAELGKTIQAIRLLGLDIFIKPREYQDND